MSNTPVDFIFCSPFHRTIQTVAPLAQRLGLPIKLEWGLSEFLKVNWFDQFPELPTLEERSAQFPEIDVTYRSLASPQYPEDDEKLQDRITKTAAALTENFGPNIFLMSHGAVSLGIRRVLLNDNSVLLNADFCSVSQLARKNGSWQSVLNGNADHLTSRGIHVPNPRR